MEFWYNNAIEALKNNDFVIEIDNLIIQGRRPISVSSYTNFISLSANQATVQIVPTSTTYIGLNGLGGVTLNGKASYIKMEQDKRGTYKFSMSLSGANLSDRIVIEIPYGTHQCKAIIYPNYGRVTTVTGNIYPTKFSEVFKGRGF